MGFKIAGEISLCVKPWKSSCCRHRALGTCPRRRARLELLRFGRGHPSLAAGLGRLEMPRASPALLQSFTAKSGCNSGTNEAEVHSFKNLLKYSLSFLALLRFVILSFLRRKKSPSF